MSDKLSADELLAKLREHVLGGTREQWSYFHALDEYCKAGDLPKDWQKEG